MERNVASAARVAARGRKRSESSRKAILRAAYDLIASDGYRALTFEAVAARSGAGRPTIYRWWPSKAALAIDALLSETPWAEARHEHSGSAARDIRDAVHRMAKGLSGAYGKVLASVLAGARDDPEILAMYKDRIAGPRRAVAINCLRDGIETGEFRPDIDMEAALDALLLPIFVKLMMGLGPISAEWIDRLAGLVLDAVAAGPKGSRPSLPSDAGALPADNVARPRARRKVSRKRSSRAP